MSVTREQTRMWAAAVAAWLVGAIPLWAQDAAEAASGEVERLSWQAVVQNGGWLMVVLAVMSLITVAFVLYFFAILRMGAVTPRPLHRELVEKLRAGDIKEARKACEYKPSPLAAVALVAIDYVLNVEERDGMLLKDVMQGEGSRQAEALEGQTRYLLDIATIAPMVGLLGTVFGMLRAFSAVALDIAQARPMVLAGGVSQALVTTAFGLIVGIPAMICYAYFRRRAATLVSQLEAASTDVLTALLSKKVDVE
ncbi:MAG: MotA/TolQ/ExbB proton channel family protein [Kiritimatiellia bacterium]|jgi:biopolymer transport protein ExbB|nr:MotA/TolQ/ExbB proton channel family protein [Kiritimatiellia bacterium]MDP6630830.1 MotA/TolQ/ExbB proton channel family protein [Kiritimatiellia bacterium]MDP6811291.1 MotA/TolQ/ExbB proton channel family protein [Kiritimatiellia bacterium]MDP7024095.1 MotA/TolQ/ExbB proton channel family protein [Kiritimatiellia bacterium]